MSVVTPTAAKSFARWVAQIMEEVASDNRTHMAAIGKEYQEMVNKLITVRPLMMNICCVFVEMYL